MNIGSTIKEFRKKKSLTLEDLHERTGLSLSYLSYLERDKRNINFSALEKIAEALGVPVPILVFLSSTEGDFNSSDKTLVLLKTELQNYINREIAAEL